jgi:hypothetical protein
MKRPPCGLFVFERMWWTARTKLAAREGCGAHFDLPKIKAAIRNTSEIPAIVT